jgi:tetratricopeptide (TPR) repeat protein
MQKLEQLQSKYFDFALEIFFLILVFLAPTVFDRRIGIVFSGTKTAVIRVLVLIVLTIWASKILIFREHKFIRAKLDWPVVSYMLACTIATLTSVHVLVSFMGFYGRYEGLSTIYVWGLLYFIVTNFIKTKEQFRRIFIASITAATLMSIYGIIQRLGTDPYSWGGVITWQRVIATIGQPNFLAAYVIMSFFFGLSFLVMDKRRPMKETADGKPKHNFKKRDRLVDLVIEQLTILLPFIGVSTAFLVMIYAVNTTNFLLLVISWAVITTLAMIFVFASRDIEPMVLDGLLFVSLPLIYICILFTQSRGGLLAFFAAGVLFIMLAKRESILKNWVKLCALAGILFLISFFTFTSAQFSPIKRFAEEVKVEGESVQEKINPATEKIAGLELKGAAGSRIETWKSAFKLISDRPVFGVGPEVLKMVFPKYETELFRFKEAFHVKQDRCHNEVFDVGVTKGLASFIIYIWLIFTFYKLGLDKSRNDPDADFQIYNVGIIAAATSYFIQNQFSFGVVAISTLLWIMFGMVSVPKLHDDDELSLPKFSGVSLSHVPWLSVAAVFVALGVLWHLSTIQFRADRLYKSGKVYIERNMLDKALVDFRKSLEISPYEGGAMTYFGITHLNIARSVPDKREWHEKAVAVLSRASLADPYNADNFYILGKSFITLHGLGAPNSLERSFESSNRAIAIDPFYAEAYHNRGIVYEASGDFEKAIVEYKKAFMINPKLDMSMQRLGAVYTRIGEPEKIVEAFREALAKYPTSVKLLNNLGTAYLMLKRDAEAVLIFEKMVKLDPKNIAARVSLGQAYSRKGELAKAKGVFLQVVLEDPTNVDAHNNLGLIYYREGQLTKAKNEFDQVLIIDPNNGYAKKMLGNLGGGK